MLKYFHSIFFRLRPRKNKLETDSTAKATKESPKKKADPKVSTSKDITNELELTLPCRLPFTGIFPVKDEKVSFLEKLRPLPYYKDYLLLV